MTLFCVNLAIDQPWTETSGVIRQGRQQGTVHHLQNHTLPGHSPSASQAGSRVRPAL